MDCPFCQGPTYLDQEHPVPEGASYFKCDPCQAIIYCSITELRRIGSGEISGRIPNKHYAKFKTIHKGQHYTVCLNWYMRYSYLEHNNLETKVDKQVARWDFIPNLTPQNIQDKLPTLLTFS